MPLFIKESLLYKIFDKIIIKPYNNSKFKIFMTNLSTSFKASFLYKIFERYIRKNPYFLSSFSYKLFRKLIRVIDKIMDFINLICKKCLKGSKICEETKNFKAMKLDKKFSLASILFSAFSLAYIIGSIINKSSNLYIFATLIFISFMLYVLGINENCYKKSIIYKLVKM